MTLIPLVEALRDWQVALAVAVLSAATAAAIAALSAAPSDDLPSVGAWTGVFLLSDLGDLAGDIEQSFLTALSLASITSAAALLGAVDVGRGVDRMRLRIGVVLAALLFAIWTDPTVRSVPRAGAPRPRIPCSRRRGGVRLSRVGRAPRAPAAGVQPLWRGDRLTRGSYLS